MCSGFGRYHTDNPSSQHAKPLLGVTYAEIVAQGKKPLCVPKQSAQWVIPSTLLSRNKTDQFNQGWHYLLVLDADDNPLELNELVGKIKLACRGAEFLAYTSRSATKECQKSHVLIPTVELSGYRKILSQKVFHDRLEKLGITPDKKVEDLNQIIYLPNRGEYYAFIHHEGVVFNPLKAWYQELLSKHETIETEKKAQAKKSVSKPFSPSHSKNSLINEFNETYSVEELLIQAGYSQKGSNFRHPNSQTGNYSASIKNGKVFTLSSADPLHSSFAQDAFNVFVILFNDGNFKAALLDAGNNWLKIDGKTWNQHQQSLYKGRKQ